MRKSRCPSCQKVIDLQGKVNVREHITCPNCRENLEIVRKFPLTLDWAEDPAVSPSRRSNKNLA